VRNAPSLETNNQADDVSGNLDIAEELNIYNWGMEEGEDGHM
jgi:hypothetical protein